MKRSLWLGYLIAPSTGPFLYGIMLLFFPATYENKEFSAETWFLSVSIFILASYMACFLIGMPLIILLKKYKKLTFNWLAILGSGLYAFIINFVLFVVMEPRILDNIYIIVLKTSLIGFVMGMVIITVFSYLAGITWRSS